MEQIAQLGIKVDSTSIKQATNELSKLTNQSGKTEQTTTKLSGVFTKANIAIGAIGASIAYVTKQGIAYNATIEKLTNGLTTLNALTSANVDNFGKQLSIQDKYNIASRESVETIAQLNKINLETPHTLNETVQIYKSMYSSMKNVGVSSEQMIDLTKKLSIAAGSSGIEFQQLLAGIDGLATGTVETGSELGRFLKSMGLGNEVLKQSTNIYETLNSKFKDVQGIIGYEEEISNLENSFDQLTGALVAPFFDDIKRGIHGLSSMFNDLTQSVTIFYDKFKSISELSTTDQLNKRAVEVAERIAEIQKDLANPSFFQSTGKLNAELRASNLELLSINDQFNKMNKLSEQKLVPTGIDRNESEIIKLAGSELSKFNLQLEDNVNKLKKVGATEAEINKFRADQLKEFNEKQNKSLDETNKKLEDTQKARAEIAQIGMSGYDKSISDITAKTIEWAKAGVSKNEVLNAEIKLRNELNSQTILENLQTELSYYEKKLQLQKDSLDKELELKGVQYANNILAIESSDKTIEQKQKLIALETDLYNATIERVKADSDTEFQDTLKSFQEDSLARQIELNGAIYDFGNGFDDAGSKVTKLAKSIAAMNNAELKAKKERALLDSKYEKQFTKYAGDVEKTKELEQQYIKDNDEFSNQAIINQVQGYSELTGAISSMYEQGTAQAKTFQIIQSGLAVIAGVAAVLEQGKGDPYSAPARMATMMGLVGSILSFANIAFGGGGGGSTQQVDTKTLINANTGAGSVLGDSEQGSESIKNSIKTLEDFAQPQYAVLASMNKHLANISSSMTGVTSMIFKSGTFNFPQEYLNSPALTDFGIALNKSTVQQAKNTITGKTYSKIGIFDINKNLDKSIATQFSSILTNVYDSVIETTKALDIKPSLVTDKLNNFVLNLGRISLKGKTGKEVEETISNIFGKVADDLVGVSVPVMGKFQKIGEGLYETLIRVTSGIEESTFYIEKLGYSTIKYNDIINKQGNIGFEALYQSILKKEKGSNFRNILSILTGTAEDLYNSYLTMDIVRDRLKLMGKGLDSLSNAMIRGAGSLDNLNTGISDFIENFYGEAEQQKIKVNELNQELSKTGIKTIPNTIAGFKALINGINTTTESGQKLYGSLITLSSSFYDVYSSIEDERKSLKERLQDTKALTESEQLKLTRERELATVYDATNIAILKQIYAQEDLNAKNEKANESIQNQISNRTSLIDSLSNFVKSINNSISKDTTFREFSTSFNSMINAIKAGSGDLSTIGNATIETAQSYLDTVSRTAKSSAEIEFAKKIVANKFEGIINAKDITLGTINDTLKISFNEDSVIVKALNDVKNELVYLNQLNTRQTANSNKTLQLQRASIA